MWTHTPDRGQRLSREIAASVKTPGSGARSVPGRSRGADLTGVGKDGGRVEPPDIFEPPVLSNGTLGLSDMRAGYLIQCQR